MRRHHVIVAHVIDVQKLILCRYLLQRDDLNAIPLTVGRAHKQVAEVVRPFGAFHSLVDVVHILRVLRYICHVHAWRTHSAVRKGRWTDIPAGRISLGLSPAPSGERCCLW